ncbi:E3 ubiquitin-protein ligase HERC2 [Diplogelasinospora grovesii]|uniref:E3 ubiquitin-protein ligase HERC2 n=1 Tax=Diplogelasinospora grovesii TaxID=303347 RepID=A0AAN6NIF5_9PEZI|nr:E3 ubiquitin-protein ligase HERC2 [Diplogelasinospora grovesii]
MALYVAGFNAWNQLESSYDPKRDVEWPADDIDIFTRMLEDEAIDNLRPFFSYTLVDTKSTRKILAGLSPSKHIELRKANEHIFDNCIEAFNGVTLVYNKEEAAFYQFPSISDLLDLLSHPDDEQKLGLRKSFTGFPDIKQFVSYDTGFAALSSSGQVWTWGDERYAACLGRDVDSEHPADRPGLVTDLEDLPTGPITSIAAGGYMLAALTEGRDLYCWGHAGRSSLALIMHALTLTDRPTPVVISEADEDSDVVDVAVGESHMLALTAGGRVYVIGDNEHGQLGFPGATCAPDWTDISDICYRREEVTKVLAGRWSSFIVVKTQK